MIWLFSYCVFFFKQKTAYEMRISDWSSDVCSSDLNLPELLGIRKTAQCGHAIGESDVLGSRLTAHGACSRLRVLLAQDARDAAGCEAELGELIRLQPYAHGEVSRDEQADRKRDVEGKGVSEREGRGGGRSSKKKNKRKKHDKE